jgi:uncharacterized cupin superfamily protein
MRPDASFASMPNVFEPEFEPEADLPAPFRARGAEIGLQAGSRQLGASLYELPPGQAIAPFHLHHNNEEMLIVISGRPTLRTPARCSRAPSRACPTAACPRARSG